MTIGFDQTLYRVNESVRAVEVCASVRGGVTLDREVVVQYSTGDQSAVGMEYVCLLLVVKDIPLVLIPFSMVETSL